MAAKEDDGSANDLHFGPITIDVPDDLSDIKRDLKFYQKVGILPHRLAVDHMRFVNAFYAICYSSAYNFYWMSGKFSLYYIKNC